MQRLKYMEIEEAAGKPTVGYVSKIRPLFLVASCVFVHTKKTHFTTEKFKFEQPLTPLPQGCISGMNGEEDCKIADAL